MPIIKSLKREGNGWSHRVHRSRKGRKPSHKYFERKVTKHYRKKREELALRAIDEEA
jgi:hypothetical protein